MTTQTFPTYRAAHAALPAGSKWSSSFGYPAERGYTEYHRAPDGSRWKIGNNPGWGTLYETEVWTLKPAP